MITKHMNKNHIHILEQLWSTLNLGQFDLRTISNRLRNDGGYDIENINEKNLNGLIEKLDCDDWNEAIFSFSELLSFYATLGSSMSDEQIIAWCFSVIVVCEACKRDFTDLDLYINYILDGLFGIRKRIRIDILSDLMICFFGRNLEEVNH